MKEEFLKRIPQGIVEGELLPFAHADNLPDGLVVLGHQQVRVLSESDVALAIQLEVVVNQPLLLLAAS